MSYPPCDDRAMELKLLDHLRMTQPTPIATFGQEEVVQHFDCRYELRGGTPWDDRVVREWNAISTYEVAVRYCVEPSPTERRPAKLQAPRH
mgnify:CR=1 FL=1